MSLSSSSSFLIQSYNSSRKHILFLQGNFTTSCEDNKVLAVPGKYWHPTSDSEILASRGYLVILAPNSHMLRGQGN
eukprot:g28149.t1